MAIHIPTTFRVYQNECEFPEHGYGRAWRPNDLPERLSVWARENEIAYLDMTPSLKAAASPGELVYFLDDGHWNWNAHRIAAEDVRRFFERQGWDKLIAASRDS